MTVPSLHPASLDRARAAVCGAVLEPLTLWVELLTVAVFEAPVFDGPLVDATRARR
jgi:hypothetical protein